MTPAWIRRRWRRRKCGEQEAKVRRLLLTPETQGPEGSHDADMRSEESFARACSLHTSGKLSRAAAIYRGLVEDWPPHFAATLNLGLLCLERGENGMAVRLLRKAVELQPEKARCWAGLGAALRAEGDSCAAVRAYESALAREQHFHPAYEGLVTSLREAVLERADCANSQGTAEGSAEFSGAGTRSISVIICSIDEAKERRVREEYERALAGTDHEILFIRDARSLCEGYNRGIARSRGEVLVFSHDDIEIASDDFAERLLTHLAVYDIIGVAGTDRLNQPFWGAAGWPHVFGQVIHKHPDETDYQVYVFGVDPVVSGTAQALDGLFMAVNRSVLGSVRFDERLFTGFHFYDIDFSFSAFMAGFKVAVCSDIVLVHYSSAREFSQDWHAYAAAFQEKHGQRLGREASGSTPREVIGARFATVEPAARFCLQSLRSARAVAGKRAALTRNATPENA